MTGIDGINGGAKKLFGHIGYVGFRTAGGLRLLCATAESRLLLIPENPSSECVEEGRKAFSGCPMSLGVLELPDDEWGGDPPDDGPREPGMSYRELDPCLDLSVRSTSRKEPGGEDAGKLPVVPPDSPALFNSLRLLVAATCSR